MLAKAEEIFIKETDIVNILLKLQEIDKLKYILFNPDQLALFKLLEKPVINFKENPDERNTLIHLSNLFMNTKAERNNLEMMKMILRHTITFIIYF